MKEIDIIQLQQMLDSTRKILSLVSNHKREELNCNKKLIRSIAREMDKIGKSAFSVFGSADGEARKQLPKIYEIMGNGALSIIWMREEKALFDNSFKESKEFYDISLRTFWYRVTFTIPELLRELERLPELR